MKRNYDFSGWATKNDLRCADGLTIRRNAFEVQDGTTVPLVWNHRHDTPSAVLGHALLENRDDGVYAYCSLNNTRSGKEAKEMIQHGDVVSLSIYANNLVKSGNDVLHGAIREVSLVLAGANPGAFIESVLAHGEPMTDDEMEAIVFTGSGIELRHSDEDYDDEYEDEEVDEEDDEYEEDDDEEDEYEEDDDEEDDDDEYDDEEIAHSADDYDEETIGDIVDTMNDEQKDAMYALIGMAVEEAQNGEFEDDEDYEEDYEEDDMKHNVFEADEMGGEYLAHAEALDGILDDAIKRKSGSLKEMINDAFNDGTLQHSIDTTGMDVAGRGAWRDNIPAGRPTEYAFNDPEFLFPQPHNLNNPPEWIKRDQDWVQALMGSIHRSPFSRIRSTYADITADEARAKGYTKTHKKTEEIFGLLKRVTTPTTIYKKQRMDRDDVIDITDFDVVAWIKGEMRLMLNEEIARAILIGDGRDAMSPDKINEGCIRPIAKDDPLFTIKVPVTVKNQASGAEKAKQVIDSVIRSRKHYKGSGNPTLFTTEDWLTEMLLLEDGIGHKLYKTESELATALRVSKIVTVELLEGQTIDIKTGEEGSQVVVKKPLMGIIVNTKDYNMGADKGGSIELFDDFDIDFNQYVWLMETRFSGALTKPYSAISVYIDEKAAG